MSYVTRCDLCAAEHSGNAAGWASVTIYAAKIAPGRKGETLHFDLCPACTEATVGVRVNAQ